MQIDKKKCVGCGNCHAVCTMGVIYLDEDGKSVVNHDECVECYTCYRVCRNEGYRPWFVRAIRGIARMNSGAIQPVMEDIRTNIREMARLIDQGLGIVFSEPSCALAVKMKYLKLVRSEEAAKVAENCYDIHQFLMMLHRKGELNLNFRNMDLNIGYHNPCHLRALGVIQEPLELLRLIPGVKVQAFSDGCCGLVGTFGMKKKNFALSMAIGERLFKEIADSGANGISTPCGACKLQILQGTHREALHPISLLASAYEKGKLETHLSNK